MAQNMARALAVVVAMLEMLIQEYYDKVVYASTNKEGREYLDSRPLKRPPPEYG